MARIKSALEFANARIGRLRFLARFSLGLALLSAGYATGGISSSIFAQISGVLIGVLFIAVCPVICALAIIQRLHDLNRSGWYLLLLVVVLWGLEPLAAGLASSKENGMKPEDIALKIERILLLAFLLSLMLIPGKDQTNKFGPPPSNHGVSDWLLGFALPLCVVIPALISIVVSFLD